MHSGKCCSINIKKLVTKLEHKRAHVTGWVRKTTSLCWVLRNQQRPSSVHAVHLLDQVSISIATTFYFWSVSNEQILTFVYVSRYLYRITSHRISFNCRSFRLSASRGFFKRFCPGAQSSSTHLNQSHSSRCKAVMSRKRKASDAGADKHSKQPKLNSEKKTEGWLQEQVLQQRTEKKEIKFNNERLRFLSDSQKIKQGSEGVLYWMNRDQRIQGKRAKCT